MRILDQNDNELKQDELNFEMGYLKPDKLFIRHHEAIPAVEEQKRKEVTEYPETGGVNIRWIVDVPAQEAVPAWDEYEDILRYTLYTEEELAQSEIAELKEKLAQTDYAVIKIAEGAATVEEYADLISQRRVWRARINELDTTVSI